MSPITRKREASSQLVRIPVDSVTLEGSLEIPADAQALVVFAHGSGSSRHSPRNRFVAAMLHEGGLGTLLFDLLTEKEDVRYRARFDIDTLTERVKAATAWLRQRAEAADLPLGYFGASTGAAAALEAAAELGSAIGAVVSRGGRPDLAESCLDRVISPTLLIVGEWDAQVLALNRRAFELLTAEKELAIVPRATHLFEEPGALAEVGRLATAWFARHLEEASAGSTHSR